MKTILTIYSQIEEILENFGLAKLMQEVENDELLSGDAAYSYYQSLKLQNYAVMPNFKNNLGKHFRFKVNVTT